MRRILSVVLLTVVSVGAAGTGAASAARPSTTTTASEETTTETTQPPSTTTAPPAFFAPSPSDDTAPLRPRSLQGLVRGSRISSAAELGLTADAEPPAAEPDPLDDVPEYTPKDDDDDEVALEDRDGLPVGASSASGGLSRSQLVVIASGAVAVLALVLAPSGGRRGPRHRERG